MNAIETSIANPPVSPAPRDPPAPPVDALDRILSRLAEESAQHQLCGRDDSRVSVQAPVRLGVIPGCCDLADPAHFTSLYDAWATDLSRTGVGLLTGHDLPRDVLMWLDLATLAGRPQLLPVRITYCTQLLASTYRIGAIFLPGG